MPKLKTIGKILFIIFLSIYILFFITFLLQIQTLVLLAFYESLPLLIPISIMYYALIDTFIPFLFQISLTFIIIYFYGFILGEIKTDKNLLSILTIVTGISFLLWFPDITLMVNASTNMGGFFIILTTLIVSFTYFFNNLRISPQKPVKYLKGCIIMILSVYASTIILNLL